MAKKGLKPVSEARNPKNVTEIIKMKDTGATDKQIADHIGVTRSSVTRTLGKYFIPGKTLEEWREKENDAYTFLRQKMLGIIDKKLDDPEQVKKTTIDKMAWAAGSLQAQERLNKGEATTIVEKQQTVITDILKSRAARTVIDAEFKETE